MIGWFLPILLRGSGEQEGEGTRALRCSGWRGATGSVWSCLMGTTSKGLCAAPGLNSTSTRKRSGLSTGNLGRQQTEPLLRDQ